MMSNARRAATAVSGWPASWRRWCAVLLAGLLLAGGAGGGTAAPPPADDGRGAESEASASLLTLEQADGLVPAAGGGVRLAATASAPALEAPYTRAGRLVSPPRPLEAPAAALVVAWTGETPPGTSVRLEARGWRADGVPSPWEEVAGRGGLVQLPWPATATQYRLTLLAQSAEASPIVQSVRIQPAVGLATAQAPAAAAAVTARVYATRIGLVGAQTANGHIILPGDRFVALPSRRVLSSRGGSEYRVRVEYRGTSLTLPVWDTGPWNVRDNYWEPSIRRDMWNDLPAGQPQAAAAYYQAYHGGRDGFGRRVLSPAGLDLSDAAFHELGLTHSDWVTVTFLWLTP